MVQEKALFIKEDLLTAIWENWNYFNKEFCFE